MKSLSLYIHACINYLVEHILLNMHDIQIVAYEKVFLICKLSKYALFCPAVRLKVTINCECSTLVFKKALLLTEKDDYQKEILYDNQTMYISSNVLE